MSQPRWPDFFLIGAAKAGSTAVFHGLAQHPALFTCEEKEPGYFIFGESGLTFGGPQAEANRPYLIRTEETYLKLFAGCKDDQLAGEGSVSYLHMGESVAPYIRAKSPQARLIAILRHPAERAFSHYVMNRNMGIEPQPTFKRALADEPRRVRESWYPTMCYASASQYARQLRPFIKAFGRDQMLVLLFEDLQANALEVFRRIFDFLKVDPTFEPDLTRQYNVRRNLRSRKAEDLLLVSNPLTRPFRAIFPPALRMKIRDALRQTNAYRPVMNAKDRQHVLDACRADTLELQEMVGRNLEAWLV